MLSRRSRRSYDTSLMQPYRALVLVGEARGPADPRERGDERRRRGKDTEHLLVRAADEDVRPDKGDARHVIAVHLRPCQLVPALIGVVPPVTPQPRRLVVAASSIAKVKNTWKRSG